MKILNFILRNTTLDVVYLIDSTNHDGIEQLISELSEENVLKVDAFKDMFIGLLEEGFTFKYAISQIDDSQHMDKERIVILTNEGEYPTLKYVDELTQDDLVKYNMVKELAISLIPNII